jgi:hypothetical protein
MDGETDRKRESLVDRHIERLFESLVIHIES